MYNFVGSKKSRRRIAIVALVLIAALAITTIIAGLL